MIQPIKKSLLSFPYQWRRVTITYPVGFWHTAGDPSKFQPSHSTWDIKMGLECPQQGSMWIRKSKADSSVSQKCSFLTRESKSIFKNLAQKGKKKQNAIFWCMSFSTDSKVVIKRSWHVKDQGVRSFQALQTMDWTGMFIFTGVLYCRWTYTFQAQLSMSWESSFVLLFNFSALHSPPTTAGQGLTLPARPNYNSTKNEYLYYTVYLHPVLFAFIALFFYNLSILFNWEVIGIVYWIWGVNVRYEKWRIFWYLRKPSPWNPSGICPKVAYAEQVGWWAVWRKEQPWPWRHRIWVWDWERASGHSVLVKNPES